MLLSQMQNDANCCDMSLYKVLFGVGWGVGWGGSCRGEVGLVIQGWSGVSHAGVGWGVMYRWSRS